jgi:hypothetical protein
MQGVQRAKGMCAEVITLSGLQLRKDSANYA